MHMCLYTYKHVYTYTYAKNNYTKITYYIFLVYLNSWISHSSATFINIYLSFAIHLQFSFIFLRNSVVHCKGATDTPPKKLSCSFGQFMQHEIFIRSVKFSFFCSFCYSICCSWTMGICRRCNVQIMILLSIYSYTFSSQEIKATGSWVSSKPALITGLHVAKWHKRIIIFFKIYF